MSKKTLRAAILAVAGLAVFSPVFAQGMGTTAGTSGNAKPEVMSVGPDKAFVVKAAEGGAAEVELGKLAASRASNPDVRAFGKRMVDDHAKANDKLMQIADDKGITVSTALQGEAKSLYEKLSVATGADFDKMYMHHMLMDHEKDVKEFEKESSSGKDADVKQFASDTLPTLREHLRLAQATAHKVGAEHAAMGTSRGNQ